MSGGVLSPQITAYSAIVYPLSAGPRGYGNLQLHLPDALPHGPVHFLHVHCQRHHSARGGQGATAQRARVSQLLPTAWRVRGCDAVCWL